MTIIRICNKNLGDNLLLPCIKQNILWGFPVVLQTNKASLHPTLLLFDMFLGHQFEEDELGFPLLLPVLKIQSIIPS